MRKFGLWLLLGFLVGATPALACNEESAADGSAQSPAPQGQAGSAPASGH